MVSNVKPVITPAFLCLPAKDYLIIEGLRNGCLKCGCRPDRGQYFT
jgi:hypothetical protein